MESLKPLLKSLEKQLDRIAVVVFLALMGAVIYFYQSEQGQAPAEEPAEVPPTDLEREVEFPDASYTSVIETLTWNGQLYGDRPIDASHPYFEIVQSNIFTQRTPPTEEEVRQQALADLEQARQAFAAATTPGLTVEQIRESLERTVRLADRIIVVWSQQTGVQQTDAVALRDQAQALLDQMDAATSGATP